ncbi:hypothetical protein L3Q82_004810 [Scortum barcoo]|uniref:Uncharacterized protein n=1 Tax=Scortum barcoo TaxID=214431 RepID=A0ACB8VDP3_9TELE|nr:hypothetical protein L3Q82_004810 [Scortum barcoo]
MQKTWCEEVEEAEMVEQEAAWKLTPRKRRTKVRNVCGEAKTSRISTDGQAGKKQHTLNVTRDITRSIKDLETGIVELEKMSESTGDRGYIEILKSKKMALASLLDVKVQGALVSEYEEEDELFEGFCSELPQVSEWTNSQLEKPLKMQELQAALQNMQGRKSPGIDGLTVEFFKAFWDILANDILDVFNENYKLLSKALANRLKEAMEQVIHLDQTYCVPGRSMVDNIYLIRDVLEVSSSLGINTGLISLDQEKAFDRVEHNFLWKVMERFGFSAGFTAKIKEPLIYGARLDVCSDATPMV